MAQDCMQQSGNHKTDQYNNEKPHAGDAKGASRDYPGLEGKYTILEKVGRGAQGTVFKALSMTGESVAIKIFDFREAESWKEVDLLKREVETLQKLDVQGIPKFIEFIEKEPYSYLVESYIEGSSLKDMIEDGFEPTFDQVVAILSSALKILSQLHTRLHPIIHRDIKPGNLIVNINGEDIRVWLVDFGTVAANRQRTNASTFAGTAGYVAPEQLFGKATPASDIYGMGMTMVHLISGVAPCDMEMDGLTLKYDKYLPANLPKSFRDMLAEMVAPNPNDRLKDAESVLKKLNMFASGIKRSTANHTCAPVPLSRSEKIEREVKSELKALSDEAVQSECQMDEASALQALEKYNQLTLKEKQEILKECHEYTKKSYNEIIQYLKSILDCAHEYLIDLSIYNIFSILVDIIEQKDCRDEENEILNKFEMYNKYTLMDKKEILQKCYNRTEQSFDVITDCLRKVWDSMQDRSIELSIESIIDATIRRINQQINIRKKNVPDELELYSAVDSFSGYFSRDDRMSIIIQVYRETGLNCSTIVKYIFDEQRIFKNRVFSVDEMVFSVKLGMKVHNSKLFNNDNKTVLEIIKSVLANDKTRITPKTSSDKKKNFHEKLWEDLSFSEQVEGCPELKQSGFTPMEVLELYAERLALFENYSLEERKEIIFKCWVHTREDFLQIVDILNEVLSTPEYAVKRRVSDVVSCAEQRLAQGRAQRISAKLTPDKSELEKWAQTFEGYSMKDKKEILSILYQETGRDCEKIVQAIKYEQDDRLPLNKDILVVNAKRRLLFGPPGSVMMNPSLQPLARTNNEAGTEIIGALENRMNALEAPINYSPFWIIFLSLAVISGSGLGLYYIFMKAGTFWGISGCVLLSSLIIHLILLLFEKESYFLLIFVVAALLVGVIAIFMWNWVAGLFALGFLIFVGSKIAE